MGRELSAKPLHCKFRITLSPTFDDVVYCAQKGREEFPFPSLGVKLFANDTQ